MTNLAVLLYFNGRWDPSNKYTNYVADGVLINTESNFATLVSIIATQLSIDTSTSKVEIRYKIDERSPPIQIHNDMGVKVYVETKKEHRDMAKYPLCVTTTEPVNLETNSTLIPLLCSDTSEDMRVIHNSYFSNTFNGIGEAIGLIGFGSCEEVDELEELAPGIIVNPNHSLFEKDQVYKNKYVLTSALKRHSILKHFQFKTTRSSSIRCMRRSKRNLDDDASNIARISQFKNKTCQSSYTLHLLEFMRRLVRNGITITDQRLTFSCFHLGKKYENIFLYNKTAIEKLRVIETNKYVYTVLDGITQFTVCLHQRTCTCGRFQLDELPCPHALFQMDPLPDESTWNTPTHVLEEVVLPPHGKRPPGRPKNKRHTQLREDGFKKAKITCSNCGQQDHNRKTCKNVRPYDQE
ncbi:hypothetical protein H5410_064526 [Solanum commersonii]|uniref:SWIM-type domain-containing protein n=1 Tax=Solanum commersonii TaxID=4109 RepID=A0A9J5VZF1_SOLCO|nr:hypothetical protein H5410_064526 [Solanum commersonii]